MAENESVAQGKKAKAGRPKGKNGKSGKKAPKRPPAKMLVDCLNKARALRQRLEREKTNSVDRIEAVFLRVKARAMSDKSIRLDADTLLQCENELAILRRMTAAPVVTQQQ